MLSNSLCRVELLLTLPRDEIASLCVSVDKLFAILNSQNSDQLCFCVRTDFVVHRIPPVFGNILMKQRRNFGNKNDESTRREIIIDTGHFGCTDCSELKWSDVYLANSRVKLARKKTGISRDLPLWPETIVALEKILRKGKLVFYASRGNPFIGHCFFTANWF